ncbi:hypothetical protein AYI70_g2237 [Smittium culicis]|uniref:Uncharacterized protein n=1 Tax=Smittium culicis TaxID=133412 RepID=A0A1R1XP20_9FUNG|nr:hypothetical protein AYI70_g6678 [Smittium culicis]OMJ23484.1 hypothetical protein AYI70_g2237 [Smittium culicis]
MFSDLYVSVRRSQEDLAPEVLAWREVKSEKDSSSEYSNDSTSMPSLVNQEPELGSEDIEVLARPLSTLRVEREMTFSDVVSPGAQRYARLGSNPHDLAQRY